MFRLALALGYSHPDVLAAQLTSRQFTEWITYYNIEPFGPLMDTLRAGVIAATIANILKAKGGKQIKPSDFFPSLRELETSEPATVADVRRMFAAALGVPPPPDLEETNDGHHR